MSLLMIADRDPNERTGISWFVSSYSIPFDKVILTGTLSEVFDTIEVEQPDVICMELDMIPSHSWDKFVALIRRYKPMIIVMTVEATFERAMQGIDVQAVQLWVKPQSPDTIKQALLKCARDVSQKEKLKENVLSPNITKNSYEALLLPLECIDYHPLMLIHVENPERILVLFAFLKDYYFHKPTIILPFNDMVVCIFTDDKPYSSQLLTQMGNRLLREWEEKNSDYIFIVFFETSDKTLTLNKKFVYTKEALEIRFFKGYRQISVISDKVDWVAFDPFLSPLEQRAWIDMLNNGEKEKIQKWMYAEFINIVKPYPEPGLLRTRLSSILAQIRRFMKPYYLDNGGLENYYHRVFEMILYAPILSRIVQEFLLFIYEVIDAANYNKERSCGDVVEQAIKFIEESYRNSNLKLDDVAKHVDRNPAYLSSLLNKMQKKSFRQRVNSIRVGQAQALLKNTNMPVYEVAEKVGFNDPNYFCKIFTEHVGMNPRDFRKPKKNN